MGTGRGARIPLWIPILVIALTYSKVQAQFEQKSQYEDQQSQYEDQQSQYEDQQSQYEDQQSQYEDQQSQQSNYDYLLSVQPTQDSPQSKVTIIPPMKTTLAVKAKNPAHNGRVCSTWGNFHFKTFDGDIYRFPGLCNYVFASHCKSSYEDFNIQIRRNAAHNVTIIGHISIKLDGMDIELTPNTIIVGGEPVQLPYSHSGVLMERISGYVKIASKLGIVVMWNQEDGLLLELDEKYINQTCGLCGDFNGISTYNEFISNGVKLNPVQFGNLQKMDGPTEQCQDPLPSTTSNCSRQFNAICETILTGEAFLGCNALVEMKDYADACIQDLCNCEESATDVCICDTFAEYSRQCAHAGGQPLEWRTEDLCAKSCPFNMEHKECGSPCSDSCTNPERSQLCEDHCTDGCFCPSGTVYDDINNSGCIPLEDCHCTYNGDTYAPGASFASQCTSCQCTGGQWACVSHSCPGMCSIEGGSHISTFDEKRYSFFGDCSYVLTKLCDSNLFTVLGEIRKCGLTDTETCMKGIAISIGGGETIIVIKSTGVVYVNMILTQLPFSASNVTIFRPSSFFIIVNTHWGLQLEIQLVPIMQLFIRLDPVHKEKTCGLCGNFNSAQADDFKAISGVVEGTSAAFANTWKTQADCPSVKNIFENPCTLSIENEKYASHWCGLLTDSTGPFQECHSVVDSAIYHTNCMFDTCNCERSEDCMCAALSSYVRACAAKGVKISGWRTSICTKYQICPKTMAYRYVIDSCQPTCRSLSEPDVTCNIQFTAVDGCTCEEGTFMDESGKCVPPTSCPCYYKGSPVPSGDVVRENGIMCTCTKGKLQCIGEVIPQPVCDSPMIYFDCDNATVGVTGAECQKSCQTLDMGCYSTQCVSGCVCPNELIYDGKGGCVAAEECPCIHNEATYNPGETIKVKCNTCTCKNRKWECSNEPCLETCSVYGDGHYVTFDGKRYSFSGDCEYTLVQDHCGKNSTKAGTFRVITENIPCGTTGTTCSKAIKVFLGNYELILTDGKFEVIQRQPGDSEVPYKIRYMGIYMVIDTTAGLVLLWDKKTSIFIKLNAEFKGQICGLCGNFDGNDANDFTTRSQSVVGDVVEFGNSWKVSPTCPGTPQTRDPCRSNPYRMSWAQKQCSIINSQTFAHCHSQVEPAKYYDACVSDACACDTGGDCECFCTAVAAYAQACNEAGVCVSWRTPSMCPLFCDYYNPKGECEWHYQPCGSSCLKTCRNPEGKCMHDLKGLEGCYPKCPDHKPYFDEDDMDCVPRDQCGCFDDKGNHYKPGEKMPSEKSCQSCHCSMESQQICGQDEDACYCIYDGEKHKPGDVIYNTTDGIGGCIIATCARNGTIERNIFQCQTTTTTSAPTTVFVFTSTSQATTTAAPATTLCIQEDCHWSEWYDMSQPGSGNDDGDFDTFDQLRAEGYKVCKAPKEVECRAEKFPNTPLSELGQKVECNTRVGLICYNKDQDTTQCHNYQIRIRCCSFVPCGYTTASTPKTTTVSIAPTVTIRPTTTLATKLTSTSISSTTPETTSLSTGTTVRSTTEMTSPTTEVTRQTLCKPRCQWTEWQDVHFPTLDNKGDFETYDRIRAAGKDICEKPLRIECRAEKFPEKTIDEIGQTVQCNVSFGFVCKNEDQSGILQMCFNYQIKVYCCDTECLTTTPETTSAGTTVLSTSPLVTTTSEATSSSVVTMKPKTTTTGTTTLLVPETTTITTTPSTAKSTTTTIIPTTSLTTPETTTVTTTPSTTESTTTTTITTTSPTTPETTTITTTPSTTESTTTTTVPTTSPTTPETTTVTTTPSTTESTTTTTIPTTSPTTPETTTVTTTPSTTESTATTTVATTSPTTPETTTVTTTPSTTESTTTTTIPTTSPTTPETTTVTTTPSTTESTATTTVATTSPTTPETTTVTTTPSTTESTTTTTIPITSPTTSETTTVTTTPSTTESTATTTVATTSPTTPETTTVTTTPSTTESTTTITIPTTSPTTPETTTITTTSETCTQEICEWSQWYDASYPGSALDDGDFDTFKNLRAKGYDVCKVPKNVECRAERYPNTPLQELEQKVICSKTEGLLCYNKDQLPPICYNYEIRIECCKKIIVPCPTSTQVTTTKPATSTSRPTTVATTTKKPSTTAKTTTVIEKTTTPAQTVITQIRTTREPSTAQQKQTTISSTKVPETTAITTKTQPLTTTPVTTTTKIVTSATSKPVKTTKTKEIVTTTIATTKETTTLPTTTSLPPIHTSKKTTISTSTPCSPIKCQWSQWFDTDFPTSGPKGGDMETYNNIRAAGGKICGKPVNIQCRAENHPDLSIDQVGQVVECDVNTGLVCKNENQLGKIKQCFNYEIRVLCCEENPECPTPPVPTTTTTTSKPVTTPTTTVTPTTLKPVITTTAETTTSTTKVTTAPTTTETTTPTTPRLRTTLPTTTSLPSTTTTHEITTPPSTPCSPIKCQWSQWFDMDFPTSGPEGGDIETYNNIRAAGGKICGKPVHIQCRAENHPDLSIDQVGQVVECDVNFGLVCKNGDQTGKTKQCLNYEIRVLCCEENPECPTPPAPTTTISKPVTTPTTTVTPTTPKPVITTTAETTTSTTKVTTAPTTTETTTPTTPRLRTTLPTTTSLPSTTTTHEITTPPSTPCSPIKCQWSQWFDMDFPTSGPEGGDIETYNNIRAAGGKICGKPVHIQCRAENHPDLSIDQVGQVVECDVNFGLVCKNGDQTGKTKQCLNYEIRVLCCEENPECPTPPAPTTTTSKPVTTPTTTVTPTTPKPVITTTAETTTSTTKVTTAPTTTETTTPTTPRLRTTLPTTTSLPSTTTTHEITTPPSTPCSPIKCQWSQWFDMDFPTSGPKGGDIETYNNIRAAGGKICGKPVHIQCRAENHPDLSIDQVGQVVECDVNFGLVCKNGDQTGKTKQCLNYEIRVLCCEENPECPTPPAPTTTASKPVTTPTTTVTPTTPKPVITTTAETTTSTTKVTTAPTTTETTTPTTPRLRTTLPTTTSLPSTTTTHEITTPPSTPCSPIKCQWSQWFDMDFPTSGPEGGDIETYNNIRAAGGKICGKPVHIQCRAENHPDLSIDQVGQVVECDVNFGLVCKNGDQTGKTKQCLNYEIRVLCCEENPECPTPPAPTTTISKPVTTPTTTVTPTTPKPVITTTAETTTSTTKVTTAPTTTETTTPTTPRLRTTLPTTTSLPSTTTTHEITTPPSTPCSPIKCQWSQWFDMDFPTSGPEGGDIETYNNIRAAGGKICGKPVHIQCRAENHPDLSIDQVGQVVECDVNFGLVCKNGDQTGKTKQCLNYEIRVLCCEENPECPTPPVPATTISKPVPTPTTTVTPTTPKPVITTTAETTTTSTTKETTPATTSKATPARTPRVRTTLPTSTSLPSTSTTHRTTTSPSTPCSPIKCQWSQWFDTDFPTSGPKGGDIETYNNIRAAGGKICGKPVNIQCRAENHPDLSIDQVGQVVECNVNSGLVCKNEDQTGKFKQCFNYEIRVLCCEENPDCPTPPAPTTTTTTTSKPVPTPTTTVTPTTPKPVITTIAETTATTTTKETTTATTTKPTTPTTTRLRTTLPTTTSLPSTTTTHEITTSPSTACSPIKCQWSPWFDIDFPTSGPKGGDIETYNNIRAAGGKICGKPVNIQCRAENHPDLSIDQVGQVMECDVNFGLVCRNRDQTGKTKQCLNYELRVLCCEENPECPTPPVPTTTTISTTIKPTTPVPTTITVLSTTSITTEAPTPSSLGSSTTRCLCQVEEKTYHPGDTIYNKTDSDGCFFYAVCSQKCSIERSKGPCPSTTPKPTPTVVITTPSTTTPSTTPSTTTQLIGCPDAVPHREVGETWTSNCTRFTCEGNNKIAISHVKCPKVQDIVCENGYPPVKVFSDDGCCYHYECECVCSGWGDPHYITFDGTYYTFLDNCTYVLVQQITPKYDHFRVLIDNYFCDAEDGLSCPQSIIIYYKSSKVVLTRKDFNGVEANKIYFNDKTVSAGFQKDGIYISTIGINMVVEIPEIEATITFSGLIFSIKLPYSKFGNNTEGQCGTCTNDRKDECRLPDGQITGCSQMAPHWRVPDDKKDYCLGPQPTVVPTEAPIDCPATPLCKMILSEIFSECHDIIPPEPFYKGCIFDSCHMKNTSMQCSGLEIYASLCASRDVCVDWRAKTQGECPFSCPVEQKHELQQDVKGLRSTFEIHQEKEAAFTCPVGKIYNPCGPLNPPTCEKSAIYHNGSGIAEGCFCPEGTKLFSSYRDICVSDCGCTGPDGLPKSPGETWISNCQECTCEKYSLVVRCKPKACKVSPTPLNCPFEGFIPVQVMTPEDKCCPQPECVCNTTYCPGTIESCPVGYTLKQQNLPGGCCIAAICVKLPGCVVDDNLYKPGTIVPRGPCETCTCSLEEDPETKSNKVECVPEVCDRSCPLGHEYREVSGQCCGNCTAVACVLKQGLDVRVIKRGEIVHPPGDNCTFYECDFVDGQYILVTTKKTCPLFDPTTCEPEYVVKSDDGCCKICQPPLKICVPKSTRSVIRYNDCEASSPVELTYCEGHCGSSSKYSYKANTMDHTCNCCKELKTSKRQVTLSCPDGSTLDYSYIHVDECDCMASQCGLQPTSSPEQQQEQEQEQQQQEEQQQEEQQQME